MNEQMINEVWKQIEGFSKYMVSNYGRVKSKATTLNRGTRGVRYRDEIILDGAIDGLGYKHVRLVPDDGGKYVLWKIHQLVATAFLGYKRGKNNSVVVDHIDSNKLNNRLDNLQLVEREWNHVIGCNIKAIERRMQPQIYWYEDANKKQYGVGVNILIGTNKFCHFIRDEKKMLYDFCTSNRIFYEQAIEEFKKNGAIQ